MSEATPLPTDTLLESLRTRQRQLELEIVALKARHDEISMTIADYTSRPRGGRRGNKPVAVLATPGGGWHTPPCADDPPPDAA